MFVDCFVSVEVPQAVIPFKSDNGCDAPLFQGQQISKLFNAFRINPLDICPTSRYLESGLLFLGQGTLLLAVNYPHRYEVKMGWELGCVG